MRGGSTICDTRSNYNKSGHIRGIWYGYAGMEKKDGIPRGYRHPYTWAMAPKDGGVTTVNMITGFGGLVANGALGRNLDAALAGYGTIDPSSSAQLIVSAVAALAGIGGLSADVIGKLETSATLAGAGDITGSLGALAWAVSNITASSSITGTPKGIGSVSANITPFTALSPESLAAAVWNAVAAGYNSGGTMGEKLNASGSASDPWTADLASYNTDGTAGKRMKDLLTKIQFIGLK
jgi:hypothetical protein